MLWSKYHEIAPTEVKEWTASLHCQGYYYFWQDEKLFSQILFHIYASKLTEKFSERVGIWSRNNVVN